MRDRHVAKGLAKSQACSKSRVEESETNLRELGRRLVERVFEAASSRPFSRGIHRDE